MQRRLGDVPIDWRLDAASARWLRWSGGAAPSPPVATSPAREKRPRSVSAKGTGRGTGRGGKPAASALKRLLKWKGKRGDFVRFIGGRTVTMDQVLTQFPSMTHANVNGYLINIWKDHGIGYAKEGGVLSLILPPRLKWSEIWRANDGA